MALQGLFLEVRNYFKTNSSSNKIHRWLEERSNEGNTIANLVSLWNNIHIQIVSHLDNRLKFYKIILVFRKELF